MAIVHEDRVKELIQIYSNIVDNIYGKEPVRKNAKEILDLCEEVLSLRGQIKNTIEDTNG